MADNNNDSLIKWARTFVTKDIERLKTKKRPQLYVLGQDS